MLSNYGQTIVSFDAMDPKQRDHYLESLTAQDGERSEPHIAQLDDMTPYQIALHIIICIFQLSAQEYDIVKWILDGGNQNSYAIEHDLDRQRVLAILKRASARVPEIKAILTYKHRINADVEAQSKGRAKGKQMSLFDDVEPPAGCQTSQG